jgi:predicted GNAT family acetyltransferase
MSATVVDNTAASRFESGTGEDMAQLVYRRRANRLVLIHTEVPEELEGHGLGGELVRAAIERAAREQLVVVPLCPFARRWIERHPESVTDVEIDWEAR